MKVKVDDLIGRDYEPGAHNIAHGPLDCQGAACAVLLRLGMADAAECLLRPWPGKPQPQTCGWKLVEDGSVELGDIYLSSGEEELCVGAVCDMEGPRVLTSYKESGVISFPVRKITGLQGIYRWCPE